MEPGTIYRITHYYQGGDLLMSTEIVWADPPSLEQVEALLNLKQIGAPSDWSAHAVINVGKQP
jgi:hypothetical protein